MLGKELTEALEQIGRGKKIDNALLVDALESAFTSTSKKLLGRHYSIKVEFNEEGELKAWYEKTVKEEVKNAEEEITVKEAKELGIDAQPGEKARMNIDVNNFGRIAAQIVKQVIVKKVRDIEREAIYEEFDNKVGTIVNTVVLRKDNRSIVVDLGDTEGYIPIKEQVFRERFKIGEKIKAFVIEVKKSAKAPHVTLSRLSLNFVRKLFEAEIPEIAEGKVQIKAIARDPGFRLKVAVYADNKNIDSVGACVGIKGGRIQPIVRELRGEKVDVIEWSEDIQTLIKNTLRPVKIVKIEDDPKKKEARVVVAAEHLAIAIGKKGHNAKLVSKITGWKIDIEGEEKPAKSESVSSQNKEKTEE
jgi:N utilization substance protein A